MCSGIRNRLMLVLAIRLAGSFVPDTDLELNRFWTLTSGKLVCHLGTQINDNFLAS